MAYGPANKLVIPTDMMNSVGAIATVAETVQLTKKQVSKRSYYGSFLYVK